MRKETIDLSPDSITSEPLQEKDVIGHYVHALVKMYSQKPAILWKSSYRMQTYSYADLYDKALRLVSLFGSMGIRKGDRICVWAYNSPEWVVLLLACAISGIVLVPIDFHSLASFTSLIIRRVGAKAILISRFKDIDEPVPKLYVEDLMEKLDDAKPSPKYDLPDIYPDDILEIIFTSGTTGNPKGVIITNRNLVSNIRSMRYMMPLNDSYRFFSILPVSHLFEQVVGLFYPLRFGASIVQSRARKTSEMAKILKKYKIMSIVCVPLFLDSLKDGILRKARYKGLAGAFNFLTSAVMKLPHGARRVLFYPVRRALGPNLAFFLCGGAKISETTEDFWTSLGISVFQGYGLTEASPVVSSNVIGQHKLRSVGRCLPWQEIRFTDDGEILIRGQNVTTGYYQDEEATRDAFTDGWFKTGDIGEMDRDRFLFIKGRKKEMILTASGFNVFPQDIESVLNKLSAVKESCAVALEEQGGSHIYAAIILNSEVTASPEEIAKEANEKLDFHQRIHKVITWSGREFPKTPTLKIKRREVARLLKESLKDTEAIEGFTDEKYPTEERDPLVPLRQLVADFLRIPLSQVRDDSRLVDDLGLDSLGIVELVVTLEEWFQVEFDESNLRPDTTISDLQKLIKSAAVRIEKFPQLSWARKPFISQVRERLQRILNLYLRARLDIDVSGLETLSGLSFPVIFASNHLGYLDTLAILRCLPLNVRRRIAVAAAAEIYFGLDAEASDKKKFGTGLTPVLGPLFVNAFPFSRRRSIRKSLSLMGEILDEGSSVILYPEGARSKTGEMLPFKPGVGMIATEMLVPVVPVKLSGSFNILPKEKLIPFKEKVKVTFGKPLSFKGRHDYEAIAKEIENAIQTIHV